MPFILTLLLSYLPSIPDNLFAHIIKFSFNYHVRELQALVMSQPQIYFIIHADIEVTKPLTIASYFEDLSSALAMMASDMVNTNASIL